jgi:hypothetical protein
MVSAKVIKFEYVPTAKMVVDILTKVIPTEKHTLVYGNARTTTI